MKKREVVTIKMDSVSENEEFARVAVAVFLSRMDPTLEEIEDVKTAVSEAVTNAVIHGYQRRGDHYPGGVGGGGCSDGAGPG